MKRSALPGLLALIALALANAHALSDTGSLAGRLEVTVNLETYAWVEGDLTPRALVTYTNLSPETIVFERPLVGPRSETVYTWTQWLVLADPAGQPVASDEVGIIEELRPGSGWVRTVTLAPGESHSYIMSLLWWGFDFADLRPPPGTYTVQAVYEYFDVPRPIFDDADEEKQWIEENHQLLFSNVVPLEVLEQGAKAPERVKLARDGTPAPDALPRMIVRGHLMADARVFKDSGADISKSEESATINRGEKSVTLPLGRWPKEMQGKHPPAIPCIGGGLLVPVRYVAESLGLRVHWDPKTKTANILTG